MYRIVRIFLPSLARSLFPLLLFPVEFTFRFYRLTRSYRLHSCACASVFLLFFSAQAHLCFVGCVVQIASKIARMSSEAAKGAAERADGAIGDANEIIDAVRKVKRIAEFAVNDARKAKGTSSSCREGFVCSGDAMLPHFLVLHRYAPVDVRVPRIDRPCPILEQQG